MAKKRVVLVASAVLVLVGCCVAGAAVLADGAEGLVLPGLLQWLAR